MNQQHKDIAKIIKESGIDNEGYIAKPLAVYFKEKTLLKNKEQFDIIKKMIGKKLFERYKRNIMLNEFDETQFLIRCGFKEI